MWDEQQIRDIAEEHYNSKKYKIEYNIVFFSEAEGRQVEIYQHFPDDLLEKMKEIKENKGMEYLLSHLEEVDEDPDIFFDFNLNREVYSIDLENPKKFYRHLFCKNYFLGGKGFKSNYVRIEVHPMDYIKLLCLCIMDKDMNFNRLRHYAPGVHERIQNSIDDADRDFETDERNDLFPYCITMPEVEEDVNNIFKLNPELLSLRRDLLFY